MALNKHCNIHQLQGFPYFFAMTKHVVLPSCILDCDIQDSSIWIDKASKLFLFPKPYQQVVYSILLPISHNRTIEFTYLIEMVDDWGKGCIARKICTSQFYFVSLCVSLTNNQKSWKFTKLNPPNLIWTMVWNTNEHLKHAMIYIFKNRFSY